MEIQLGLVDGAFERNGLTTDKGKSKG